MKNNKKFWKNFSLLLQIYFKDLIRMIKKEEKLTGHLNLISSHLNRNLNKCINFWIFPSHFLCVKPIGGTKSLCNLKMVLQCVSQWDT